ncbi:Signal transduction histidine kinase [Duganella sacchari]|uniref:histidine kinase n=1 Tax=Duganella sacchari TaxID=551987 RepID=A0A1M7REP3_9BURK|nr:sensor histidine kinase [Duganella sacchari]SHN44755.1 Signal transduction histidine kinase [Duganella sacchari]
MTNGIEQLKEQLSQALQESPLDHGKVLSLANEIAKLDSENVRFSIDASHISRLGIELVSKQETAVAELIKNAFDSDATVVSVIFKNTYAPGGELEISDNGHGMSRTELLNGFMRISTQDKVHNPLSSKFGRQRAGRKGIGRFAAQRLGKYLQITSRRENQENSLLLNIDWTQFEGGKDLFLVSSQVHEVSPESVGTKLFISGVRDAWSEAQIQRTYRYVSSLLQPFPLEKKTVQTLSMGQSDPGFKVTIFREQNGKLIPVAGEEQSIFPHALAKFSGRVDEDGIPFVKIVSKKYRTDYEKRIPEIEMRIKAKVEVPSAYAELKGVQFNAYYFITDELPSGTKSMVREILNSHGGLRVYRNGFRVLPYGEEFDDWLGLQRSSALREILPPHHNTNFLGFVEITDVNGEHFEETASREGLLENSAFLQLQDFVYRALMAGVLEIGRLRGKKLYASDPKVKKKDETTGEEKKSAQEIAEELLEIVRRAKEAAAASAAGANPDQQDPSGSDTSPQPDTSGSGGFDSDDVIEKVEKFAERIGELGVESESLLEEIGMLRVLASLGLTIGEFTHEVRHTLAGLNSAITSLNNRLKKDDEIVPEVVSLKKNIQLLQSYVRYFDDAVTQNAHRKLIAHEIRDLIGDFSEMILPTLKRQGVELTTEIIGYDLYTKPMHKSEWASIFLNLFTNSLKAIHRSGKTGKIHIRAESVDEFLRVDFSDNGDGVPKENNDKIYDAFFTTSAAPGVLANDSEKLVGTGLGLKIVRDILDAANGEIELVPAEGEFATCFRIEVPLATTEEIGDEHN